MTQSMPQDCGDSGPKEADCKLSEMPNPSSKTPSLQFDLDGIEPERKLEAWRDFYLGWLDIWSLEKDPEKIDYRAQFWTLDEISLCRFAYNSHCAVSSAPSLRNASDDVVILGAILKGRPRCRVNDAPVEADAPHIGFIDLSGSFHSINNAIDCLTVVIPNARETIGYNRLRHPSSFVFHVNEPIGRILFAAIKDFHRMVQLLTQAESALVGSGLIGMLRRILNGWEMDQPQRSEFERHRLTATKEYIDRNLRSQDLTIDSICRDVGLSRATLYRMFEKEDGVARYIWRRRLEKSFVSLGNRRPSSGLINRVSAEWGFSDQAAFSRQFRNHFGFAPSEIVGERVTMADTGALVDGVSALSDPDNLLSITSLLSPTFASRG